MTLLEKAKEIGVEFKNYSFGYFPEGCPSDYGLESKDETIEACRECNCDDCYAREYKVDTASPIKDSGDRTTFSTSAQRDMHEGKGRFDLLPMCVLMRLAKHYEAGAKKYDERNWEKGIPCHSFADSAMRHFVKYMDGHTDEDHLIAAIWNLCGLAWTEEKKPELMDIPSRKADAE